MLKKPGGKKLQPRPATHQGEGRSESARLQDIAEAPAADVDLHRQLHQGICQRAVGALDPPGRTRTRSPGVHCSSSPPAAVALGGDSQGVSGQDCGHSLRGLRLLREGLENDT